MEYITSRGFKFPHFVKKMADQLWFNMWRRRQWPYREVVAGDVLYWYEAKSKSVVWQTRVAKVHKQEYRSKPELAMALKSAFGVSIAKDPYFKYKGRPSTGVCLAYKVIPVKHLNISYPVAPRFPRLGWSRPGERFYKAVLGGGGGTETTTLDSLAPTGNLSYRIRECSKKMALLSSKRVTSIVELSVRRDTPFVRLLKRACAYKCLFPGCKAEIQTAKGTLYVEVAHILPVHKGGRSTLGNLLVLCPNHHKEFDLGERVVYEVSASRVRGTLNGRRFDIHLPWGEC